MNNKVARALKLQFQFDVCDSSCYAGLILATKAIAQSTCKTKQQAVKFCEYVGFKMNPDEIESWFGRIETKENQNEKI